MKFIVLFDADMAGTALLLTREALPNTPLVPGLLPSAC